MARHTINLPDPLSEKALVRSGGAGKMSAYVRRLIESDLSGDVPLMAAPDFQKLVRAVKESIDALPVERSRAGRDSKEKGRA